MVWALSLLTMKLIPHSLTPNHHLSGIRSLITFGNEDITELEEKFTGIRLNKNSLSEALEAMRIDTYPTYQNHLVQTPLEYSLLFE